MGIYLLTMFGGSLALTVATELTAVLLFLVLDHERGNRAGDGRAGDGAWACTGRRERDSSAGDAESQEERGFPIKTGGRTARVLLLSVLVNILTNPAAVLVCWLGRIYLPMGYKWPLELTVEALVVAVEGYVYFSFRKKPLWRIGHPLLLSAWANGCSWLLGVWLNG